MDQFKEEYCDETSRSWKDVTFDAWTASSIGDIEHLHYITTSPNLLTSSGKNNKQVHTIKTENILHFDAKNKGGWTCLMYAAYYDHADVTRWLLEGNLVREYRGPRERLPANPNLKNGLQRTALMLAASCGHNETVETILHFYKNQTCEKDFTVNIKIALSVL